VKEKRNELSLQLFFFYDSYENGNEVSDRGMTYHYISYCLLLVNCILFHYSYDSYKNGNEVSERGMTCHHSSYLLHYSYDSYKNGNEVSERGMTCHHSSSFS